jgi:cytosine/adenosine deaminase-related metal-dependent hydrolase
MREVDLLIFGGTVLPMDDTNHVFHDGAVAIESDRIVAVGPTEGVRSAFRGRREIEARRKAVLPGLIDTHGHAGHTLVRTIGAHCTPYGWRALVDHVYFRCTTEDFWYADGLLSAVERLKFGTTTGVAMLGSAPRVDRSEFAQRFATGYGKVGNRVVVGVGPPRPPWPKRFSYWDGMHKTDALVPFEQVMEVTEELLATWHGRFDGRIMMCVSASRFMAPSRFDPMFNEAQAPFARRQAFEMRRLADRYRVGIHTHSYGGAIEYVYTRFEGVLDSDVLLAHCTGLSEREVEILATTRTAVAHCPSSTRYFEDHAPCPVPQLVAAGVRVAIATDGTNTSTFDLFKDVRNATFIQRYEQDNRWVLPPGKALKMVTIDAARALGLERELGSLEVGKQADLILVDLWKPHLQPIHMVVDALVEKASGTDVDTVICAGKILMEGRRLTTVNQDEVLELAVREAALMRQRAGVDPLAGQPAGYWDCSRY